MWELDHKEGWVLKNWCFWTVVLEKALESPLDYKEIKPVNPKGNQSWIFIGRTEAEAPILWPTDGKSWLTGKDPDAGRDWGQEEKGMTEDEMVGWHHRFNGHEFEQALGVGDGQGSLVWCSPWGCKVGHDWATELNWTCNTESPGHWRQLPLQPGLPNQEQEEAPELRGNSDGQEEMKSSSLTWTDDRERDLRSYPRPQGEKRQPLETTGGGKRRKNL